MVKDKSSLFSYYKQLSDFVERFMLPSSVHEHHCII